MFIKSFKPFSPLSWSVILPPLDVLLEACLLVKT